MPLQTITALDLEEWSARLDSESTLPILIRRLINETTTDIKELDFPSAESTRAGGWDGWAIVEGGNAWVPAGTSGWELGTERDRKGKADEDYEKRTAST